MMVDSARAIPQTALYPLFRGGGVIEFEEKPVPSPGVGQILIECGANALCASDMGFYHGGSGQHTPGHEFSGTVVAAGAGAKTRVGSRGVVFLMDFCGECRSCRLGLTNQCLAKRADYGFSHSGGYGPYAVVNENVFFAVTDDITLAEATLLLDVMGTGGHTLGRARMVHPDPQSLLVMGAGPIGLGVLAMAKLTMGKDFPVLIADVVAYRLGLADRMGGLPVDLSKESLSDGMKRLGFAEADLAVDSSGKSVARRSALDALAKRGVLVCPGHGEGLELNVSPDLIGPERAVLGSEYFAYDEMPGNLSLLRANKDYVGQIITHRFPRTEIQEAFQTFVGRECGKVVVES